MRRNTALVIVLSLLAALGGVFIGAPPALAEDNSETWVDVVNPTTAYGTPITLSADVGDIDAPDNCSLGSCLPLPQGAVDFYPVKNGVQGTIMDRQFLEESGSRLQTAGTGEFQYCCLLPGTYKIRGYYVPNPNQEEYHPSSGESAEITVTRGPSTTTINSHSPTTSTLGEEVTFQVIASRANFATVAPTGAVDIRETVNGVTTIYATQQVDGLGFATIKLSSLPAGTHNLVAYYAGDTNFDPSTSAPVTHTVTKGTVTNTLTPPATSAVFGEPLSFTATVAPVAPATATPTGTVDLFNVTGFGTVVNPTQLVSGAFTFTNVLLPVGEHTLDSRYGGDTNYGVKLSNRVTVTVTKANTTTAVSSSQNPSTLGQPVTLKAKVLAVAPSTATPTGTVQFFDGASPLTGQLALVNGEASFTTSVLGGGSHSITAVYSGSTGLNASTSPPLTQTVTCDRVITGSNGSLTLGPGTTCISNATIGGGITLLTGARVSLINSSVAGLVSTNGAPAAVLICGSTLNAGLTVSNVTGLVVVGDPDNGCAPNKVFGYATVASNHGGVKVIGNQFYASLAVNTNDGGPIIVGGNKVGGNLDCTGNNPAAVNGGKPNTVAGRRSGNCAAPTF